MTVRNVLEFAVIQPRFDGSNHGEPIGPCQVFMNGESPNADVRAVVWSADPFEIIETGQLDDKDAPVQVMRGREPGFVDVDRLSGCEVIDGGGKYITIRGTSDKLQQEQGMSPANAFVEWQIELRGCQGCS